MHPMPFTYSEVDVMMTPISVKGGEVNFVILQNLKHVRRYQRGWGKPG